MEWLKQVARPIAPLLSPRHRRWQRLLSSLDFDPSDVPGVLDEPGPRNFIICGCPRTGTSLLSAQLFQPPHLITVMEPWDGLRMPAAELFRGLRSDVDRGVLSRGRLDVEALTGEGKVKWRADGATSLSIEIDEDYRLGVKWPAFWRYLQRLSRTRFLVCVRNPVETVASFKRSGGRLAEGLEYDVVFNSEMNAYLTAATDDDELRRVLLYEYINSRILAYLDRSNVLLVRYEQWFDDADGLRSEISDFLEVPIVGWPAAIKPPASSENDLSRRELDLIREHGQSAIELGYESVR
jgi:hypothetical protein